MPWCPNCKQEYVSGTETCSDCGCRLVENEPQADQGVDLGNPVYLTTAADEFEADIIVSKLKASGILSMLQYSEFGSVAKVYCGRSNFEVKVLVPESQLEDAQNVIHDVGTAQEQASGNEPSPNEIQTTLFDKEDYASSQEEPQEEMTSGFWAKFLLYVCAILLLVLFLFFVFRLA